MARVVVLLGAPGSGKSSVDRALGELGLRWREWEPWVLERWGSGEDFVAHKVEALADLHKEIRAFRGAGPTAAVIESTGLSDREFLDALQAEGGTLFVRLDVSEAVAVQRVTSRPQGEHLADDVTRSRAVWRAFDESVRSRRAVDLVINTEDVSIDDAVARILEVINRSPG